MCFDTCGYHFDCYGFFCMGGITVMRNYFTISGTAWSFGNEVRVSGNASKELEKKRKKK